jgi:hypothetical protein
LRGRENVGLMRMIIDGGFPAQHHQLSQVRPGDNEACQADKHPFNNAGACAAPA